MSAPGINELPKVATDFKSELEGFKVDQLKNTDTNEKIVLPTAEGKFITNQSTFFYCLFIFII